MIVRTCVLAAVLSLAAGAAGAADAPCHLTQVAQLDMSFDGSGRVHVPALIAGQSFNLMLDTGGVQSLLTQSTVDRLGLHPDYFDSVKVTGFGGYHINRLVHAHDVILGGLRAGTMMFLVLPDEHLTPDMNGILGPDVLRAYDDDFDFANGHFNLFEREHCDGNLVYWTDQDHSEIPFKVDQTGHIKLSVQLDGQEVDALLDTGASGTVLALETAQRLFGFQENDPRLKPLRDTPNGHTYKFPFKTMTFGGVRVDNPDIVLVSRDDSKLFRAPSMLLGITILRQLHMYISYRQEKIFVTAATAH